MKTYTGDKTILIVEDNKENARLLEVVAKRSELNYIVAVNGIEAIEKFKTSDPSMILMDIQLPEMNGIEAMQAIRGLEKEKGKEERVPIVAITAYAMREDRDKFIENGADEYLCKPIDLKDLYDIFDKYFL